MWRVSSGRPVRVKRTNCWWSLRVVLTCDRVCWHAQAASARLHARLWASPTGEPWGNSLWLTHCGMDATSASSWLPLCSSPPVSPRTTISPQLRTGAGSASSVTGAVMSVPVHGASTASEAIVVLRRCDAVVVPARQQGLFMSESNKCFEQSTTATSVALVIVARGGSGTASTVATAPW